MAPKKVLVVGAGAAGMSCAHHLSNHPEKFDVTVVDAVDYCGGQAFSIPIDKKKHGAGWLNQGVQGGSYIFHHTMTMFAQQGYHADPVELQVSFGKGSEFFTNVFPTELLEKHTSEIKRFARMIKIIRWFEIFFALLPIKVVMKLFFFSEEFTNLIVLPLVALFLGTGNATPEVPAIILERLFTSPTYGMWFTAKDDTVVDNLPPMVVFPNFENFYGSWKDSLQKKGVKIRLSTQVTNIIRRDKTGVTVRIVKRTPSEDGHNPLDEDPQGESTVEEYDELVLCCLADTAKKLLGKTSTFRERTILGGAKFSDDITVTHYDSDYMKRKYENFFNEDQARAIVAGKDHSSRVQKGRKSFMPMYYIRGYDADKSKLEMSFDCTNYQAQFPEKVPFDKHIFQTIFLNNDRDSHLWEIDQIDKSKIIRQDWWHQLCHSWTHYVRVVPWMWLLNGQKHTRYAASWTLVNAHETAVISGISAAVNLGAEYPKELEQDGYAFLSFRLYYLLTYTSWYKRRYPKQQNVQVSGPYGGNYEGPGVSKNERTMYREDNKLGL